MSIGICVRCDEAYERHAYDRRSVMCARCKGETRGEYQAAWMRGRRALAREIAQDPAAWLASVEPDAETVTEIDRLMDDLSEDEAARWYSTRDEHAAALRLGAQRAVPDVMPAGWNKPHGDEVGASTEWKRLDAHLDVLAATAAADPWWDENPNWAYELHEPVKAYEFLRAA